MVAAEEPSKVAPEEAPAPPLLKVRALGTFKTLADSWATVPVAKDRVAELTKVVGPYLTPLLSAARIWPCWVGAVEVPVPPFATGRMPDTWLAKATFWMNREPLFAWTTPEPKEDRVVEPLEATVK